MDKTIRLAIIIGGIILLILMVILTAFPIEAANQEWKLGDPLPFVFATDKDFDCDDAAFAMYYVLHWLADDVKIVESYNTARTQRHVWVVAINNGQEYAYDYGHYRRESRFYHGHEIPLSTLLQYIRDDLP